MLLWCTVTFVSDSWRCTVRFPNRVCMHACYTSDPSHQYPNNITCGVQMTVYCYFIFHFSKFTLRSEHPSAHLSFKYWFNRVCFSLKTRDQILQSYYTQYGIVTNRRSHGKWKSMKLTTMILNKLLVLVYLYFTILPGYEKRMCFRSSFRLSNSF
jgi:hypothetical protein